MVQEFSPLKSHGAYISEALVPSLGAGLGEFMGNYYTNKTLQDVLNDPKLKNATPSERQFALQSALAPYGERGRKFFADTLQIEQQRQQEQAFEKLRKIDIRGMQPQQIMTAYLQALQNHPQAGKIINAVLPYAIQQANATALYGQGSGSGYPGNIPNTTSPQAQPQPSQPNLSPGVTPQNVNVSQPPTPQPQQIQQPPQQIQAQPQPANQIFPPAEQGQGVQVGGAPGLSAQIIPEEEIERQARSAVQATGNPELYNIVRQNLQARNAEKQSQVKQQVEGQALETARQADILQRNQQLQDFAQQRLTKKGSAPDAEEMNDFMRIGQKYSNLQPTEWFEKTRQDFDKFMNIKSQFDKAFVPGALRGLYLGGEEREKELTNLTSQVQDLKKYGKGSYARNRLAELGLTQTEIEKVYNPLPKSLTGEILKLPKGVTPPLNTVKGYLSANEKGKINTSPQVDIAYAGQIADFLMEHGKGNSLLAMRDEIMNKRHYSWQQYLQGLDMAEQRGFQLNPEQQAEREELRNPPRDSIPNIFRGLGNILEFFRGAK